MTVLSGSWQSTLAATLSSTSGAQDPFSVQWAETLKNSGGSFIFDRLLHLDDYSLTTGAGNLDIDLFDLASLDVGMGAGRDNIGLTHSNAKIVGFAIRNQVKSPAGSLRIDNSGAGAAAWTGIWGATRVLDIPNGGWLSSYWGETGLAVTDATNHILRLSAQTNDVVLDLAFLSA